MGEMRNAYEVSVGKPRRKRPSGRPRRRWEDDIRIDVREIRWEFVDWMHLAEARDQWWTVVNTVVNLQLP
jgi:hypothetical protein